MSLSYPNNSLLSSRPTSEFSVKTENLLAALILGVYTVLIGAYALGGPLFSAGDEVDHFSRIYDMAHTGEITSPSSVSYEFHHAPLYYLMAASLARPLLQDLPADFNRSLYLHFSSRDNFPSSNPIAQAARLVRLFSAALGFVTLLGCRLLFHILWPDHPPRRILALGIVAFWPQLQFLTGAVTNDALAFCISTLCLASLMYVARHGYTPRNSLILGVLLGAALLTKVNNTALLFPVAMSFLLTPSKQRGYMACSLIIAASISGWWYLGNWLRTGDPTNQAAMVQLMPEVLTSPAQRTLPSLLVAFVSVYNSLWVNTGVFTVNISKGVFRYYDLLTLAGCIGLVWFAIDRFFNWRHLNRVAIRQTLIAGSYLIALAGVISYSIFIWIVRLGRFALPGIGLLAAVLALGLTSLIPHRLRVRLTLSLISVHAAVSIIILLWLYLPALRQPPANSTAQTPFNYRYGSTIELVDTQITNVVGYPGDIVLVTLDWRALRTTAENLEVRVIAPKTGESPRRFVFAAGKLPVSQWQAGESWREVYYFQIPEHFIPGEYPLLVIVSDRAAMDILPIVDHENRPIISPYIGRLTVLPR